MSNGKTRAASERRRSEELLEKYRQGKLSAAEDRELSELSLNSQEVFEALALDGLIEQYVADPALRATLPAHPPKPLWSARSVPLWRVCIAAAFAIVATLTVYWLRTHVEPPAVATRIPTSVAEPATRKASANSPTPTLEIAPGDAPILLAARLSAAGGPSHMSRGTRELREVPESRPPARAGVVLSIVDDEITIGLGSLDGLVEGLTLPVSRGGRRVGMLRITGVVHRDTSRALIAQGGPVAQNDQTGVPLSVHLTALDNYAGAFAARGDWPRAREVAESAVEAVSSGGAPPRLMNLTRERLAEIEFRAGNQAAALRYFDQILESPDLDSAQRLRLLEAVGVIRLLQRDLAAGEVTLTEAERLAVATGLAVDHARALNNLAVLAEMRNHYDRAAQLLEQAHAVLVRSSPRSLELRAIRLNIERLRKSQ